MCAIAFTLRVAMLSNVGMGGNPSAPWDPLIGDRYAAAVGKSNRLGFVAFRQKAAGPRITTEAAAIVHHASKVFVQIGSECPCFLAQPKLLRKIRPKLHRIWIQPIHVAVALVEQDQPVLGVEHQQPLRHIVECGLKQPRAPRPAKRQTGPTRAGNLQSWWSMELMTRTLACATPAPVRLELSLFMKLRLQPAFITRRQRFMPRHLQEWRSQVGYTSRLCSTAASMKEANNGCGAKGRDFSSGWNCTPMNQG